MKKIVFTFGRFTPPTIGHAKLINKVVEYAKKIGADNRIYTSKTFDTSKNPIPYKDKVSFLRELFPNATIADDPNAHTGFHVAKILSDEGYRDVTMVVGSDRVEEFRTKIGKYIKDRNDPSFDPKKHYSFDKFTVVSAGERDPDAQGVEGMSGTKMREAVRNNDFKTFASGIPSKNAKLLRKIYNTVKKNLNEDINLVEEIDHKKFGPMLDSFTDFASKKLGIKSMPNIELSKEDLGKSFGGYNPAMKSIVVVSKNRHPMDIFRTVAHELVHHKQNEDGRIGKDISNEGATGSDIENEANSEAGKIMRWFAKTNPEIFKSGYVVESADLTEGLNDPGKLKAIFLAGGPGSGKDFVMNRTLKGHGLTEINSDIAFEHLMSKEGLSNLMPPEEEEQRNVVRGRAKNIAKEQQRLALAGRRGVIINGTADDPAKIAQIKNELEKSGYETKMLFVNTNDEVSRQRNVERGKMGKRKVPDGRDINGVPDGSPDIRGEKWKAAQEAKDTFRKLFGDENFQHVDNSDDYNTVGKKRKKEIDDEHLGLFNHYRKFTSAPVASEKGQEWIESEKAKRGVSDYKPAKSTKVSQKPAKPAPYQPNASELEQARRLGVQHLGDGQFGVGDKRQSQVTHVSKNGQLVMSESLHDWFNKSKSKDGKKGWVQVGGRYDGKPCARQPGQTSTPKCRSSSEAASMTKKEKQYAFKKKNREDPNQPEKSGAAKPKMVKTYKDQQESVSMDEKTLQEKKDACYSKVKARYKVWPSAYASGALVRCRKVGADNWGNKSKVDENFENFVAEEGGAGEWGTDKLRKRYEKDTPGQGKKEKKTVKKLIQDAEAPLGYEFGNNGLGPTFGVLRSPTGLGYGYSIPMSESVKSWMENERTIARFKQRYGELAEQKLIETANMLNEMEFEKSMPKHFGKLREAWEAMAGRDMGTVAKQGSKEEIGEKTEDVVKPAKTVKAYKKLVHPQSDFEQKANKTMDEDWQEVNRKDKTDGLSQKAVDAYRRENPGSKLQTAVTEKKPTGKRAKRRLSFCRRMKGMKKRLTSAETARDPDSRINKALRRWNCEE